ncbi:MAG: magnesium transporter [Burkholderiales bacterium]|nr:magnesium transporter [Burkholderiales bacterium]
MSDVVLPAVAALSRRFLLDYPREAAREIEKLAPDEAAALLAPLPANAVLPVWQALLPDAAAETLKAVPAIHAQRWLRDAEPAIAAAALSRLDAAQRDGLLGGLDAQVAKELREMLAYPEDVAGRLMDPNVTPLRAELSVGDALQRLKGIRRHGLRELFVVDADNRLTGRVEIQDLAITDAMLPLRDVTRSLIAAVAELAPREEIVGILQRQPITELPVVNVDGHFVGVIRQSALVSAIEQESSVDIQTMVGVSRDERALSSPTFAVAKRLPWLQINLLTAFLAAAVVGLFEGTIAKFTALAVLLPVVAGQSGNAGAQALAVTMRGLVLREFSVRQWRRVVGKEAVVGLVNGIAVAATTALGVYVWSRSFGLVLVCALAMVISMLVAGLAGALTPVLLRRFGQDPATSSSIILTTVTDVVGFFSFLGIATLLADLLVSTAP